MQNNDADEHFLRINKQNTSAKNGGVFILALLCKTVITWNIGNIIQKNVQKQNKAVINTIKRE